jgi:hypothetical protein
MFAVNPVNYNQAKYLIESLFPRSLSRLNKVESRESRWRRTCSTIKDIQIGLIHHK